MRLLLKSPLQGDEFVAGDAVARPNGDIRDQRDTGQVVDVMTEHGAQGFDRHQRGDCVEHAVAGTKPAGAGERLLRRAHGQRAVLAVTTRKRCANHLEWITVLNVWQVEYPSPAHQHARQRTAVIVDVRVVRHAGATPHVPLDAVG